MKFIKELILLLFVCIVAFFVVGTFIQGLNSRLQYADLQGKVTKQSLTISSPVYGEVTYLPIYEGMLVTKGEKLAVVTMLNTSKDVQLPSNTNIFHFDNQTLTIVSPETGIINQVAVSEDSIINPQSNFIQMFPVSETVVDIALSQNDDIGNYMTLTAQTSDVKRYKLHLIQTLPVSTDADNNKVYYAQFANASDSKLFYDGQAITIHAQKKISPQEAYITQITNEISSKLQPLFSKFHI